ncbi:MAG: CapA family protein, partial [Anaerolineaceae bacterium]
EAAPALARAGFTHLHLANNHIIDYGTAGLANTIDALRSKGIVPLGVGESPDSASRTVVSEVKGFQVGWLACGRTLHKQEEGDVSYWEYAANELLSAVQRQPQSVDLLIVSLHIGLMYLDYPDPAYRDLAHQLTAAGADLVLMHHAHVLQGVEFFDDKIIAYCLGNALWDWQEGHVSSDIMVQERQESAIFVIDWSPNGVSQVTAIPIYIDEQMCVQWAAGARGQRILARLERLSRDLSTGYEAAFAEQRASRNMGHSFKVIGHYLKQGQLGVIAGELARIRPAHLRLLLRYAKERVRRPKNV